MGLLALWDKLGTEPVLENVASRSDCLKSYNNLYELWHLLIPKANGAHAMRQRQVFGAILQTMRPPSSRINSDDGGQWLEPLRGQCLVGLLALWDTPGAEPVLENVASPSGCLKSDSDRYKSWPLLIPAALVAHAMCQRHVYGAMLEKLSPLLGRAKSDDNRQRVGPLRSWCLVGLLAL